MVKAEPVQSATRLSFDAVMEPPRLSPTAAQKLTPAHETERNSLTVPAGSFGLATAVHVVPFHISASVRVSPFWYPTAMQKTALRHDTALKTVSPGAARFGVVTVDHAVPFQCSTRGAKVEETVWLPTATQNVALVHATPVNDAPVDPAGMTAATTDQAVPFHCSKKGSGADGCRWNPAATQNEVLVHETVLRIVSVEPAVLGLGATAQDEPFHCVISAWLWEETTWSPTWMQNVDVTHDTPLPLLPVAAGGCGTGAAVQLDAVTCAGTVGAAAEAPPASRAADPAVAPVNTMTPRAARRTSRIMV
jgi:hypothetical protein